MRLELGTFPVERVRFGAGTRWDAGLLTVDREAVLRAVREDPLVAEASLDLARPGESVRIWPVRDVVEPRVKVSGPGVAYPGWFGRSIETVGRGRTHRLAGVGVTEVSSVNWHDAGGDFVDEFIDMSGPWAALIPQSEIANVCLVVEPEPALAIQTKNEVVHRATLAVSDALAAAVRDLAAPSVEVFELSPAPASLPGVVYIQCVHSPQAMSHSEHTFCTGTYGLTRLTPPWLLHPNEILDGALSGPYRTLFATSWTVVNNPILLDLYRRHGRDLRLLGVIAFRTEWTTQTEKDLMAEQAAKLAQMLGAQGAIVTWDAGGNEYIEVVHTVRACERLGIKTVFLTSEDDATDGVPTMLEPLPEADAIVSTSFFKNVTLAVPEAPAVQRVIGLPTKKILRGSTIGLHAGSDGTLPTAGPLPVPWRYDDHYGFGSLSCIE
jgi:glycine reductase